MLFEKWYYSEYIKNFKREASEIIAAILNETNFIKSTRYTNET